MKSKYVYIDLTKPEKPILVRAAIPKTKHNLLGAFAYCGGSWGFRPTMTLWFEPMPPEMLRRLADMLDTLQAGGKLP